MDEGVGVEVERATAHGMTFAQQRGAGHVRVRREPASRRAAIPVRLRHAAEPPGVQRPLTLRDGELAEKEERCRGSVATQLGLPRPALRYATWDALATFSRGRGQVVLDLEGAEGFVLPQGDAVHDWWSPGRG